MLVLVKPARDRSVLDRISASMRSPATVRPLSYDLDVDPRFPQVLPAGVISPKSRFTSDLTAASLGVFIGTHQVTDKRRTTVDHFTAKDRYMPKILEGVRAT